MNAVGVWAVAGGTDSHRLDIEILRFKNIHMEQFAIHRGNAFDLCILHETEHQWLPVAKTEDESKMNRNDSSWNIIHEYCSLTVHNICL